MILYRLFNCLGQIEDHLLMLSLASLQVELLSDVIFGQNLVCPADRPFDMRTSKHQKPNEARNII